MSSNLPPVGPPSGPPPGPPPSGPPPAGPPPAGPPPAYPPPASTWPGGPAPEYLEAGGGHPLPPHQPTGSAGGGRKKGIIGAAAVIGLGAVAAGAWAAVSFFGTGAQPAQALPASTLGYVSIDLDPGGGQKIEAVRTLRKFPAFKDEIGLDTDDDIRERIFEEIQKSDACEGLDYADDIEPWLGDRMAVAAVDLGEESPTPVLVVQVKDADQADEGLATLRDCGTSDDAEGFDESQDSESSDELGGWSIDGEWAVIAETQELAEKVADAAAESSLADDDDYQRWTGEAGDAGILTAYAAPEAGQVLAEELGGFGLSMGGEDCGSSSSGSVPIDPPLLDELPSLDDDGCAEQLSPMMPDEVVSMFEDFEGAALTVRFDDGSLEVETAAGTEFLGLDALTSSDRGGTAIATLPEDTAAAFGLGFEEGWFDELIEYAASVSGEEMDVDELIAQAEAETGLSLPEDAETLAGESVTFAVSSDFDPEEFFNSGDGSDVPVGVKIKGDADGIESVLAKITDSLSAEDPDAATILGSDSEGDYVVIGPNADYRAELLEDGGLGDSDTYQDVVREAGDAGSILFVNFDAGDGWLANLAGDDHEVQENLEPLSGLGISAWEDDGVGHSVLRITTN